MNLRLPKVEVGNCDDVDFTSTVAYIEPLFWITIIENRSFYVDFSYGHYQFSTHYPFYFITVSKQFYIESIPVSILHFRDKNFVFHQKRPLCNSCYLFLLHRWPMITNIYVFKLRTLSCNLCIYILQITEIKEFYNKIYTRFTKYIRHAIKRIKDKIKHFVWSNSWQYSCSL